MKRIKRGWALTKKSWGLLNSNRELLRLPLYGAVATIPLAFIFLGPGLYFLDDGMLAGALPLLVLGVYVLAVVGTFFGVALAATADMLFRGERATVGDGLAVARSRFSAICGWAALATAISVVMGALENQGGVLGTIAARLVGMAWSLITFLAVPVIAIEGTGPLQTLKRSAGLFRERWGQQITGNLAIGGLVFLIGMLPSALLVVAGIVVWATASFVGALLVVLGIIGFAISMLISQALSGIFGVALYRYALDGEAVGGFTPAELESAVRSKNGRNAPPTATPGTI